uniref:Secreted protein n=1 Tax=Candidatus Kentrum sp. UNK TaxID=2126344 RepID=A0A451ASG4_9GAMM|nr:MAG: hypothetical protein BECKUNK1418G_GA0071005_12902 [Candidatus Kentron sp. UNK]VFK73735.1 MAG: hypothetical protein BECKUNK1418H_GA0071006_12682 [Candidatus Kentron sp. UNK]
MKILKGSLVAAFLALGMWASQASAGCVCPDDPPVPSGAPCEAAFWCPGGSCGCSMQEFQNDCCSEE